MATRYSLENFLKLAKQPEYVLWELQRLLFDLRTGEGIDVMEQDWDNLILLDACRYDAFEAQSAIDGNLKPVLSRGGASWEFMQANFAGRELHDTV
ncbi:MAG: hypothetical protein U5K37_09365 [Natrialbaceae archaeon]|nr:hypothetical protein [Natrialbaceae archaeon]